MSKKNDVPEDKDNISYVVVEMIKASDVRNKRVNDLSAVSMEKGLFLGLVVKHESMFIATTSDGKDIRLYNIDSYNISMIEYGNHNKKFFMVFTKDVKDQNESIETLGNLLASFQRRGIILQEDERFVDFEKLKGHDIYKRSKNVEDKETEAKTRSTGKKYVPDYVLDDQDGYGGMLGRLNQANNNPHYRNRTGWEDDHFAGQRGTHYSSAKTYEKKFTLFSRKSAKPTKKKLNEMMNMVAMVFENKGSFFIDNQENDVYNSTGLKTDIDDDSDAYYRKTINDWDSGEDVLGNMPK